MCVFKCMTVCLCVFPRKTVVWLTGNAITSNHVFFFHLGNGPNLFLEECCFDCVFVCVYVCVSVCESSYGKDQHDNERLLLSWVSKF